MTNPPSSAPPDPSSNPDGSRLKINPRDALVLLLAAITGLVTGLLTFGAGAVLAQAVLAGLAACGTAIFAFDRLIR